MNFFLRLLKVRSHFWFRMDSERYSAKKGKAFTVQKARKIIEFCSARQEKINLPTRLAARFCCFCIRGWESANFLRLLSTARTLPAFPKKREREKTDVLRKIPLSPMLKKVWYLIDFKSAISASAESIRRTLKQIFQGRHPHELRYTFITRAKECDCNAEAVMLWAGHCRDTDVSASRVDRGYTTFSGEFLVSEMQKFMYW